MKHKEEKVPEHMGHRKRIKERYLEMGFSSLDDKDVIELLLTYAIPRKDVYRLARELFHDYGSVANLISTDTDILLADGRISQHTAVLFKLVNDLRSKPDRFLEFRREPVESLISAATYCHRLLGGLSEEIIVELFLDANSVVTDITKVSYGDENSVVLPVDRIVRDVIRSGSTRLLIAHNHPSGDPTPSEADILATTTLERALRSRGVTLLEHIVVALDGCVAIMHDQHFKISGVYSPPWREPEQ